MLSVLKRLSNTHRVILVILFGVAATYGIISFVVDRKLETLSSSLDAQIQTQQELLKNLSETIANGEGDDVSDAVVRDCAVEERTRFDTLLARLNEGLSKSELQELDRLFGRCGSYFAERKAIMTNRLSREVQIYEAFVEQRKTLEGASAMETYRVDGWKQLAEEELKQAGLFMDMVVQQDTIITLLLEGKSASSPEIKATLEKAGETQGTLLVSKKQAATIRTSLVSS